MLHGAHGPGIHDVGAVLIFHDGHELAGTADFLDQVDNYERSGTAGEGTVRGLYMANYDQRRELERTPYDAKKGEVAESAKKLNKTHA